MIVRALFVLLLTAFLVQNVAAQSSLRAQRVQTPPAIDGRLDDAVWNAADTASGFRQIEPNEGAPETEPTELPGSPSESVESCGILYQDGLALSRVRHPDRKLVEHSAVIDLPERGDIGGFAAGH